MSALAIQSLQASPLDGPREERAKAEGFHGELQRARNEPPKTIHPRRDRGRPAPPRDASAPADATAPPPRVVQDATVRQATASDAVAATSADGKALAVTGAGEAEAQVQLDPGMAEPAALETVAIRARVAPPTTPLEQAVHDLIDRLRDGSDKAPSHDAPSEPILPGATLVSGALDDAPPQQAVAPAAVREPPPAEQQVSASHVHLVIDDGERLVVTVAVRGNEVIAHVRGDNEATAAVLARNAGVLDDAMRARGLNLAELQTGRDPAQPERHHHRQEERERPQPRFRLEENP